MPSHPKKQRRLFFKSSVFLYFMMAVCAAAIVVFAVLFYQSKKEYTLGDTAYAQLRQSLQAEAALTSPYDMDFTPIKSINPDTIGWIYAEGTEIDYPIAQGQDNEYYLTHLITGQANKLGAIFMDYRNKGNFEDKNTVIYGHNMHTGSMFSSLTKYKDQAYYQKFPSMNLYTPNGNYTIEFFAGMVADGNYEFVRFNFKDDTDFETYINTLKAGSTFKSEVNVSAADKIVSLCTCSYEFNNARYALFGKLTPLQN